MNNNIQNKELEKTHIKGNSFNQNTDTDELKVNQCQIYTALGDSANGKQLYTNGVMDIDVQLVITFNRNVTMEEMLHFKDGIKDGTVIFLGYYDNYLHSMQYVNTDKANETYFIDEQGFYTGMIQNRDKKENMFYQLTLDERSRMEKESPEMLEAIKNNNNYYEAYGNQLKSNQVHFYTTMRAGPMTPSRTMSFRIIMPNGDELFTYNNDGNNPFATLDVACLSQPTIAPRTNTGIRILRDQHIRGYDLNIWACGVVELDLVYINSGGLGVDVFAIYSADSQILRFEADKVGADFGFLPETGSRCNGFSTDGVERRPTHFHTFYNMNTAISGNSGGRTIYSRKSFSIQNPYRITFDPYTRKFSMFTRPRDLWLYENITMYFYEKNQFGHTVNSEYYDGKKVPEFIRQDTYSSNIFVTASLENAVPGHPSSLMMTPDKDRFSIVCVNNGNEANGQMPIVVMDRYGTRHNLTLADHTVYTWESARVLKVASGLSVA